MIGFLRGHIILHQDHTITLQATGTGIGYEVFIGSQGILSPVETEQSFWIHHHRTEASELLFGFQSPEDRALFRLLLKVNGIGGKTAMGLLGLGNEVLMRAIQMEDDACIASVPGIGKKTAQKIIVELKGSIDFSKPPSSPAQRNLPAPDITLMHSLVGMGYDKKRVEAVLATLNETRSLEERTIQAIRELSA